MPRPSLVEIAAMPFPNSLATVRRHYDPHWGIPPDVTEWEVDLAYEVVVEGSESYRISAATPEEAEAIAKGHLKEDHGKAQIDWCRVRPQVEADAGVPLLAGLLH